MMIGLGQSSGEQVSCTSPSSPSILCEKGFALKIMRQLSGKCQSEAHSMYLWSGLSITAIAGPIALTDALQIFKSAIPESSKDPYNIGMLRVHTTTRQRTHRLLPVHIYENGKFFHPCNFQNIQYCEVVSAMESKPAYLAGMHHFSGSWHQMPITNERSTT